MGRRPGPRILARCAACRAEAAALTAVVDRLSVHGAGGRATSPASSERVLQPRRGSTSSRASGATGRTRARTSGRAGAARPAPTGPAVPPGRRRPHRSRLGRRRSGWLVAEPGRSPTTHALLVSAMRAPDGVRIGQAVASEGPSPWVTVSVDLPPAGTPDSYPDGLYTVVLGSSGRGGARTPLGQLRVRGAWAPSAERPAGSIRCTLRSGFEGPGRPRHLRGVPTLIPIGLP